MRLSHDRASEGGTSYVAWANFTRVRSAWATQAAEIDSILRHGGASIEMGRVSVAG